MKIAVLGDIHLRNNSLSTRITDYNTALFKKLEYVYNYCNTNNISKLIFLGDIITSLDIDLKDEIKNRFILQRNKYKNIETYTILGNHDLHSNDLNYLYKSSVLTMALANAFKLLIHECQIENIRVVILDPDFEKSKHILSNIVDNNQKMIILGHHLYNSGLIDACLKTEDFKKFNTYKQQVLVFLGHDHTQYVPENLHNVVIHRLGSLMRTEKPQQNTNWQPRFAILDTDIFNVKYEYISCESYEEAFGVQLDTIKYKHLANLSIIKDSINKLGTIDYSNLSISGVLKNLNCPDNYMNCLKDIHLSLGETF